MTSRSRINPGPPATNTPSTTKIETNLNEPSLSNNQNPKAFAVIEVQKDLTRPLLQIDDNDPLSPSPTNKTRKKKKSDRNYYGDQKPLRPRLPPSSSLKIFQQRLINRRSFLLALSLTLILSVFWLLDSLKDPTFAVLCGGDLKRHQPLAKMASVGGTLLLVLVMEVVTHHRERRRQQEQRLRVCGEDGKKQMAVDDVLDGGGVWTKMDISDSLTSNNERVQSGSGGDGEDATDSQISISTFRTVGITFICVLLVIAYLLSLHPDTQPQPSPPAATTATTAILNKQNPLWLILGYFQYIVIESYGSITVATFWSFLNSTLSLKAAKRYYGFIIAMAQVGAIGGSTVATLPDASKPFLIVIACFGIVLHIAVMHLYGRNFPRAMVEADDAAIDYGAGGGGKGNDYEEEFEARAQEARRKRQRLARVARMEDGSTGAMKATTTTSEQFVSGFHLVLKHDYLLLILGVSCLYEISLTCLDYQMKLMGLVRFSSPDFGNDSLVLSPSEQELEGAIGAEFVVFMGRYGQLTNLLSFLLSYFAFPYLMEHYGLSHTIRIFPTLLLLITLMTFVALPMNLPLLFVSMSLLKALTYSINDPAKEILYIPTGNVVKFKAKFWIDVVGARIAKAIGSSINTYAGTVERVVIYGSVPSVISAAALWVICLAAGMRFDSLLEGGEIVGIEEDEKMEVLGSPEDGVYGDQDYDGGLERMSDDDCTDSCAITDTDWESSVSIELIHSKSP